VQRVFTDGYFHKHRTAYELKQILTPPGPTDFRVSVAQMARDASPAAQTRRDAQTTVWLLVIEFCKRWTGMNQHDVAGIFGSVDHSFQL
jgi:hypothetical protein